MCRPAEAATGCHMKGAVSCMEKEGERVIKKLISPGLIETGPVSDTVMAIRDGPVNLYVVKGTEGLVCIDAGWRMSPVARGFAALGLRVDDVRAVFLTHTHRDHAGCLSLFPGADVFVGTHEVPLRQVRERPVNTVRDGATVMAAGCRVRVIEVPGHTSGSLAFLVAERMLFSGDALSLKRGRVKPFPFWLNWDSKALARSIRRLAAIEATACLLTAHSGISCDMERAFSRWRRE